MYAERFITIWKFVLPLALLGYISISIFKKNIPFKDFATKNKDVFGYFIIQIVCMISLNFLMKYNSKDNLIARNFIDIPNLIKLISTGVLFVFGVVFIIILIFRLFKKYVPIKEEY